MIHRLVKLTFQPELTTHFEELFAGSRSLVRGFPGCRHLEIWRDRERPNVYYTYSKWMSANALEAYRQSDTFAKIWAETKKMFADKPEAWSFDQIFADHG